MNQDNHNSSACVKKTTCLFAVIAALLLGGYIGATIALLYTGGTSAPQQASAPMPQSPPGAEQPAFSQEEMQRLEQAAKDNPTSYQAWTNLGHFYFDANKPKEAIDAYLKSLELAPNNADVWTDLGVMYRRNDNPEMAVKAFDTAIKVNPTHEIARFNKGIVQMHDLQDNEGAIDSWKDLVTMNPNAKTPSGKLVRELIQELRSQ